MATWTDRIQNALSDEREWRQSARRAVDVYRKAAGKSRGGFNILWPNTEIKAAAVFARKPKPVVRRRFGTDSVTGKISLMLERNVEYQMDVQPDWMREGNRIIRDLVLPGRGVARVRYVPKYRESEREVYVDDDGRFFNVSNVELSSDEIIVRDEFAFEVVDEVIAESVPMEHVPWAHFTHDPQEDWRDVRWIAFHHKMSERDAIKAFGKSKAKRIIECGDHERERMGSISNSITRELEPRFSVQEVWDREKEQVLFIGDTGDKGEVELMVYEDPYRLREFWPIPEPLRAVETPGTTLPVCEYSLYEEQANELSLVTRQIDKLIRQVRVKGVYDATFGDELRQLVRTDDNVLVPVQNWASMRDGGGMRSAIEYLPFSEAAAAAGVLYQNRAQLLDTIYQIIGLSDIMRGASDARETAAAQQLKSQYGGLRLQPLQASVQRFFVHIMEMQVELMAEKFDLSTLQAAARIEIPREAEIVLRGDVTRQFAIDIESDSTLALDDQQAKADRAEFMNAFAALLARGAEAQAAGILDQRAVVEIVKFGLQPYRISRELEDTLDRMGQSQPNQQQDQGAAMEAQAKIAAAMAKQAEVQVKAQAVQARAANDAQRLGLDAAKFQHEQEMDRERLMLEALEMAAGG